MSHLIVGAGGTASWLVPLLRKTISSGSDITVCDGDILEERNLDRQLFAPEYIGYNKAEALGVTHGINYRPVYLQDLSPEEQWGTLWCCADNHLARKHCLDLVDLGNAQLAIIGGNEYTDSEAYGYLKSWKDTSGDPRRYYPELVADLARPANPACQGLAQGENRQLALANYLSAGFMVHLWWFITNHGHEVKLDYWPTRHFSTFSSFNTKVYDVLPIR